MFHPRPAKAPWGLRVANSWHDIGSCLTAAAIEPGRWIEALGAVADATRSDRAQLIGFGRGYAIDFNWASGEDNGIIAAFADVPPPLNFRVVASQQFREEAILDERHYDAVAADLGASDYIDLCRKWDIPFGCQTTLRDDTDGLIGLALLRSAKTGPTGLAERAGFDRIRRQAAAAVALQIAIERQGFRLIAGAFEAMSSACFVLDRTLRVRAITPLAEDSLREGILRQEDGRLASPLDRADAIPAACRALNDTSSRRVILVDQVGAPISLQFHRLPAAAWSFGFEPFAVAVLTRATAPPILDAMSLRSAFGLTGAEAEITLLLRSGLDRDAIRAARGITHETLRSHFAAIFAKLGVRSEIAAVRLLGRLR